MSAATDWVWGHVQRRTPACQARGCNEYATRALPDVHRTYDTGAKLFWQACSAVRCGRAIEQLAGYGDADCPICHGRGGLSDRADGPVCLTCGGGGTIPPRHAPGCERGSCIEVCPLVHAIACCEVCRGKGRIASPVAGRNSICPSCAGGGYHPSTWVEP